MIEDVIVSDRLHLIDLGVMRKLLQGWRAGVFLNVAKWSSDKAKEISTRLTKIVLPSEIHRKFRTLNDIQNWKGSEYSSFLHYGSIVVLKNNVSKVVYEHFLLFYCAITLLSSNVHRRKWEQAGQMLIQFVSQFNEVYSEGYVTSNVHNLVHVYDEVAKFGALGTLSAYPFENELQHIKNMLRNGYRGLQQVANRLSELDNFNIRTGNQPNDPRSAYLTKSGNNLPLFAEDRVIQL
ncbi:uncharacterized protein LOC131292360 [Anopheles ziemanni]|uniref:uncharacterized protein LOC131270713 n=1 Tax=Anopheles coustani TaxID=139045 RepID=UPI002657B999|nr:uncharacterized protein LOC131270713 [Anopheles coustani]XP_058176797.1 uncharacterized protein LOC131292360 [Anopheles ziemanni]